MKPSKSARQLETLREAKHLGFAFLTPDEHRLIEQLRWTTHAGRQPVYTLASQMRRVCPWVFQG